MKIEFAEGCFDNFDGTQEELEELIAEIQRQFESGDLLMKAVPLSEKESNELLERLEQKAPRQ